MQDGIRVFFLPGYFVQGGVATAFLVNTRRVFQRQFQVMFGRIELTGVIKRQAEEQQPDSLLMFVIRIMEAFAQVMAGTVVPLCMIKVQSDALVDSPRWYHRGR